MKIFLCAPWLTRRPIRPPSKRSIGLGWGFICGWLLLCSGCGGSGGTANSGQAPDPVVVDLPIAYIQRPLPRTQDDANNDAEGELIFPDILNPTAFNPGAAIFIKARATAIATPINITDQAFIDPEASTTSERPQYDVKDLSVHPAGDRLLFAMRAPKLENVADKDQPRWNIWEYDLTQKSLRRIIPSDIVAEAGDDLSPRYLPDDRIVFSSTRQTRSRAILLDDGKPQYAALEESRSTAALVLHVMENDGSNIQQISYNQSHDLYPLVLQDGRILYTRWDNMTRSRPNNKDNRLSFYTLNPDGTQQAFYYGYHSLNPKLEDEQQQPLTQHRLFHPQQLPDGRLVVIYMPNGELLGGDMVVIDGANFSENTQPLPQSGAVGKAESSLSILPIVTDGTPSPHGFFASLHPLYDGTNRLLVSWSQCRLVEPITGRLVPCTPEWLATEGVLQAPPFYGIWIYNLADQSQQPVVLAEDELMFTEAVTLEPHAAPNYLPSEPEPEWALAGVGVLHIRSIYDFDGLDTILPQGIAATADPVKTPLSVHAARFLRIIKAVSMPDNDTLNFPGSAFGFSPVMREIIGYVPIEPDGSVKVKLPADVAFTFEIVDVNGRRLNGNLGARHQNWLQLRPGETRSCQGCHTRDSTVVHGRQDTGLPVANKGASTTGLPFPNTEPALFADLGETMAEVYARINGVRTPSVDLVFDDEWTDPAIQTKASSFAYRYTDLIDTSTDTPDAPAIETPRAMQLPTSAGCAQPDGWSSLCRVVINYESHIQPLWEKNRQQLDTTGQLLEDHTCTSCHSPSNADNMVQIPAAQLDLTSAPSPNQNRQFTSYRELLGGSVEQEIINGVLIDRLIPSGNFERDEEDELILDSNGLPIPILVTVPVNRTMTAGSARNSSRFFARFTEFDPETETLDHSGYLNPSEMKLLSEWLDIGGAYYNNPFDSVVED